MILWHTPSPSCGFVEEAALQVLPGRTCVISFTHEGRDDALETIALRFHDVVAFKVTYLHALPAEVIQTAYDRLVDVGQSPWLAEANAVAARSGDGVRRRHLRICFDDGPCCEFICKEHEVEVVR
jgi:hypothetical protein